MSSSGVLEVLKLSLLDPVFRERVATGSVDSLAKFDLTNDERNWILNNPSNLVDEMDKLAFFPRVTLIRAIVAPERDMSAALPNSISLIDETKIQNLVATIGTVTDPGEKSRQIAALIAEIEPKRVAKPTVVKTAPPFEAGKVDIFVVGLGINGFDQVTPETMAALKQSKHVFFVSSSLGADEFFAQNGIRATDLMDCYQDGEHRSGAYQKMAEKVIAAALAGGPVTLAEYGHPTIFAYPPFIIGKMAKLLNLRMKVLPAISAMDCIFAELMIDPAHSGLQMYEATDLLLRDRPLQADVAALIWQVGSLETALYSNEPSRPERFVRLVQHLVRYYPTNHKITAIYSTNHPLLPSKIYEFELWSLPDQAELLHPGFTIYIPPSVIRRMSDYAVEQDIRSATHLAKISKAIPPAS